MKVIAKKDDRTYLCEVEHKELEKFLGLYYNKFKKLSVGDEVDLGKGYDFHSEIVSALKKTRDFFESHESTVRAIANGFLSEAENLNITIGGK